MAAVVICLVFEYFVAMAPFGFFFVVLFFAAVLFV